MENFTAIRATIRKQLLGTATVEDIRSLGRETAMDWGRIADLFENGQLETLPPEWIDSAFAERLHLSPLHALIILGKFNTAPSCFLTIHNLEVQSRLGHTPIDLLAMTGRLAELPLDLRQRISGRTSTRTALLRAFTLQKEKLLPAPFAADLAAQVRLFGSEQIVAHGRSDLVPGWEPYDEFHSTQDFLKLPWHKLNRDQSVKLVHQAYTRGLLLLLDRGTYPSFAAELASPVSQDETLIECLTSRYNIQLALDPEKLGPDYQTLLPAIQAAMENEELKPSLQPWFNELAKAYVRHATQQRRNSAVTK